MRAAGTAALVALVGAQSSVAAAHSTHDVAQAGVAQARAAQISAGMHWPTEGGAASRVNRASLPVSLSTVSSVRPPVPSAWFD